MKPIRVLSVDDYVPLREYLRTILEMEDGIELVGEAENGAQAVEEARRLRPDVIIMDVDMPVLNGLEATRQILQEQPQAKVIFLVAEVTWRTQAKAVGASAFLLKDTPPDELVAMIRAQVSEPEAARRLAPPWAALQRAFQRSLPLAAGLVAFLAIAGAMCLPTLGPSAIPSLTATATATPTATPTPTPTVTSTATPTATPAATPTVTSTPTATPTPTVTSTATPTPTSTSTSTPTPTSTSTSTTTPPP
ncbi:MAG: response regulator transcription factor, partial [Dehalococcoidia bacterium]